MVCLFPSQISDGSNANPKQPLRLKWCVLTGSWHQPSTILPCCCHRHPRHRSDRAHRWHTKQSRDAKRSTPCVEPSLIRIWWQSKSIIRRQQNKNCSFLFLPNLIWRGWKHDTPAVWRQRGSAHVCSHAACLLSHPTQTIQSFSHCFVSSLPHITRSKHHIVFTSSVEMLPSPITCCIGAGDEEHMFGGGVRQYG